MKLLRYIVSILILVTVEGCGLLSPGLVVHTESEELAFNGVIDRKPRKGQSDAIFLTGIDLPEELSTSKKQIVSMYKYIPLVVKSNGEYEYVQVPYGKGSKVSVVGSLDALYIQNTEYEELLKQAIIASDIKMNPHANQ